MNSLTAAARHVLEKFFNMSGGYVLNFNDRTFDEFIFESVGLDIHDKRFTINRTSKANKLRTLWKVEPDHLVGKLLTDLIDYDETIHNERDEEDVVHTNLGTICNGLAELRGLYGTGHGKHGNASGLGARHAKLAVGAATTLAIFLFETHQQTKK